MLVEEVQAEAKAQAVPSSPYESEIKIARRLLNALDYEDPIRSSAPTPTPTPAFTPARSLPITKKRPKSAPSYRRPSPAPKPTVVVKGIATSAIASTTIAPSPPPPQTPSFNHLTSTPVTEPPRLHSNLISALATGLFTPVYPADANFHRYSHATTSTGIASSLCKAITENDPDVPVEVRGGEERSDELIMLALGTKATRARTSVQDAPSP